MADAVLAAECFLCGREGGVQPVCRACAERLPLWAGATACPCCGLPGTQGETCGRCLRAPPGFDGTLALFEYGFPVVQMVQALKYGGALELAPWLGTRLSKLAHGGWDVLLPVPLHARRLGERGFNQALELARPLAKAWGVPVAPRLARRVKLTPAQAGLSARERARNLRAAFQVTGDVSGLRVAVVDDVMTTGATLDALARALKAAGAARVDNLVVARTPSH